MHVSYTYSEKNPANIQVKICLQIFQHQPDFHSKILVLRILVSGSFVFEAHFLQNIQHVYV